MLPPRSSIPCSCTPFARHAALASESKNAFTACAGIEPTCSMCNLTHCGTLSAYPSPTLLKHFITKTWADRKRATAATPWPSKTGPTRLRSQPSSSPLPWVNTPCPPTTPRLISRSRAVLLAPPPSPPCGQEAECHGRSTTGSPHDQSGQRHIHEELADAHLALRPAPHMPSHPPPPPSPSRVRLGQPQPGASPCSLALKVTDSAGGGSTRVPRILYA